MEDSLYTVKEVATILKTTRNYIYKLIASGQLTMLKCPTARIRKSEINKFIEKNNGFDLSDPYNVKKL